MLHKRPCLLSKADRAWTIKKNSPISHLRLQFVARFWNVWIEWFCATKGEAVGGLGRLKWRRRIKSQILRLPPTRWQFIHHFPGNLHLKPCQHFRWALIAPFQNFCKRAHLLRNLRALKHLKGWSKLCLSVPLFLDAIALSVGQSVSQWFIVSDLEMAIASSSFASLFYIRR